MALTDNIVSYWKCDESVGDTTLVDAISATNNLAKSGSAALTTSGKINNGTILASSTSDCWIGNATNYLSSALSISFWAKMTAHGSGVVYPFITKWRNTGDQRSFQCYEIDSDLKWSVTSDGGNTEDDWSVAQAFGTDVWHHVVITWLGSSKTTIIYFDGSSILNSAKTGVASIYASTAKFEVSGQDVGTPAFFLDGSMDEIGVWSRVLTSTEVITLYNSGNGLQYPFSTSAIKTINGLAKASVKTVNGLAIASVKTINGLA